MKLIHGVAGAVAVGVLALAGSASAQIAPETQPRVDVPDDSGMHLEQVDNPDGYNPKTGFGVGLMAGGGGGNYVDDAVRANTGAYGSWNIRAILGTRTFVGFEGAYVGAAGSIDGFGLNSQNTLIRNGVEGLFRVQVPIVAKASIVEPYVFGGLGWDHYAFTSTPSTADLTLSDDVLTSPFGAGISGGYRGFLADVRFTYRPTFDENIFGDVTNTGLTNWNVGGSLGYEF